MNADTIIKKQIQQKVSEILARKKNITGQINVEFHLKEGVLKDVYIIHRNKVNVE